PADASSSTLPARSQRLEKMFSLSRRKISSEWYSSPGRVFWPRAERCSTYWVKGLVVIALEKIAESCYSCQDFWNTVPQYGTTTVRQDDQTVSGDPIRQAGHFAVKAVYRGTPFVGSHRSGPSFKVEKIHRAQVALGAGKGRTPFARSLARRVLPW